MSGATFLLSAGEENHMYHSSTLTCNPRSIFLNRLPRRTLFCFAVAVLLLSASTGVRAQATSAPSAEQIQALQKKLDALQSQMAEVQGELQRLSGGSSQPLPEMTDLKSAIAAEQQEAKSQIEAELTPK